MAKRYELNFYPQCAGGFIGMGDGVRGIGKFYDPDFDRISNLIDEKYSAHKKITSFDKHDNISYDLGIGRIEFNKHNKENHCYTPRMVLSAVSVRDLSTLTLSLSQELPSYFSIPFDLGEVVEKE